MKEQVYNLIFKSWISPPSQTILGGEGGGHYGKYEVFVLDRFSFRLGTKKMVTSHIRQLVTLYKNDCMGIDLRGTQRWFS